MVANIFGPDLGYVVVIVLVVLFGGSQLPKIARNIGSAGKEFRKAQLEAGEEAHREADHGSADDQASLRMAPTDPGTPLKAREHEARREAAG